MFNPSAAPSWPGGVPHAAARPASSDRPAASRHRENRLARETSASFVAFDILARGEENYTQRPFAECRAPLVETWQLRNLRSTHTDDYGSRPGGAVVRTVRGRGLDHRQAA